MTVTVSLDGISSSTIPELVIENVSRQITPAIRDVFREVPGRVGSWLFEEVGGDRELALTIAAVGDTLAERRAAVRAAGAWLYGDGLGRRKLIVDDEPDRFVWAKLAGSPVADELMRRGRFEAGFRTSAFSESVAISTDVLAGSGSIVITPATELAAFFEPSIEVTATAALGSGFSVDVDGTTISYGAAMALNDVVTISTLATTVTTGADTDTDLEGIFDPTLLAMTSVSGDFPVLRPGTNTVTLSASISASFRWRERYV